MFLALRVHEPEHHLSHVSNYFASWFSSKITMVNSLIVLIALEILVGTPISLFYQVFQTLTIFTHLQSVFLIFLPPF
jgi:hypothetical protein